MLHTLDRAQAAVARVEDLDKQLGERLTARFKLLAVPVKEHFEGVEGRDVSADARFLADGETIVAETLAFLGGASARMLEFDDGIAALAQAWLDRLSGQAQLNRVAVVIPAAAESAGMETQIVRLKVPTHGVWGLPVAVHEYGHFVASELKRRQTEGGVPHQVAPVESLLHAAGAGGEERDGVPALYWQGHELFADAVASAVTGPAYLRYCLRYRFDPSLAHEPEATHPSPAVRVRMQLAVLNELAADDESGYLRTEVDDLAKAWEASVAEAAPRASEPDSELDKLAEQVLEVVRQSPTLKLIRYQGHGGARALADQVSFDADPSEHGVPHVLNAAWVRRDRLERRDDHSAGDVMKLGDRARKLIADIVAHG